MHRHKNLSYPNIAKELGVSTSMVEKYIIQALKAWIQVNMNVTISWSKDEMGDLTTVGSFLHDTTYEDMVYPAQEFTFPATTARYIVFNMTDCMFDGEKVSIPFCVLREIVFSQCVTSED